jgi:RNA-binding protein
MQKLTTKQRSLLRSLAHPLRPVLQLGKEGVSPGTVRTVESAFANRELIKIKVLDSAPEGARESAAHLAERVPGAHVVQVIGKTVVLYRAHPEKPIIPLPAPDRGGSSAV